MVNYPSEWNEKSFNEFMKIKRGASPRPIESYITSSTEGVNWIKIGDAPRYGKYITSTTERITPKGAIHSVSVYPGDFILSNSMSFGRPYILNIEGCIHDGWLRLYDFQSEATDEFLYYLLSSSYVQRQYESFAAGSGVQNLNKEVVKKVNVVLPSIPEQEEIARTLSQFDTYIDDLAELIEKKKSIRDGVLEDLISGRTRLAGFEETWSEKKLRELCTLITKQTGFDYSNEIKASLMEYRTTNSLPFIQNKDFEGFTINYQTDFYIPFDVAIKYPKIVLDEVCLLISISGRIGNVAVFNNKETAFAGGAVGIAKLIDPELATWCMLYISSSLGQKQIFANEKVGAQHNLTVEDVRNLIIKLPKSEEREAIVATIKSMDEEIKALETEREKMILIREGAMDDLLTGRVRLTK